MASHIFIAINYAKSLIGIPYRWYVENTEPFTSDDKFWVGDGLAPTAEHIKASDKSIVCAGLINLMRRKLRLLVPTYGKYPGGTVAWYEYLTAHNYLIPIDDKLPHLPIGTLLLKKYKNEADQGHMAVITDDNLIIHAAADIPYELRHKYKNHGCVKTSTYSLDYFTHICLPENWLLKN